MQKKDKPNLNLDRLKAVSPQLAKLCRVLQQYKNTTVYRGQINTIKDDLLRLAEKAEKWDSLGRAPHDVDEFYKD